MNLLSRPRMRSVGSIVMCALTALLLLVITTGASAVLAVAARGTIRIPGLLTVAADSFPGLAHATFAPVGTAVWFVALTGALVIASRKADARRRH